MLFLWDKEKGKLLDMFQGQGFLGIYLEWGERKKTCVFINVYAPCNLVAKKQLWVELLVARHSYVADVWCILGDFNSVRSSDERKGVVERRNSALSKVVREDKMFFNLLIENLEVEDLALFGRKFTWIQPNGDCSSRLDRILVSSNWNDVWGGASLWALSRDVSDHCPIILRHASSDWGPKPFRFNNYWLKNKDFKVIVDRTWREQNNKGWMAHVFREKLKAVKEALKRWNVETYGAMDRRIPSLVDRIQELEVKGEVVGVLSAEEKKEWKQNCEQLWSLLISKDSLLYQISKAKWLKEGDTNSSYLPCLCERAKKCKFHCGVEKRSRVA
jgi:hypothetical protein